MKRYLEIASVVLYHCLESLKVKPQTPTWRLFQDIQYLQQEHILMHFNKCRPVIAGLETTCKIVTDLEKCRNVVIMKCRWVLIRSVCPIMRWYLSVASARGPVAPCVRQGAWVRAWVHECVRRYMHFHQIIEHINVPPSCQWSADVIRRWGEGW